MIATDIRPLIGVAATRPLTGPEAEAAFAALFDGAVTSERALVFDASRGAVVERREMRIVGRRGEVGVAAGTRPGRRLSPSRRRSPGPHLPRLVGRIVRRTGVLRGASCATVGWRLPRVLVGGTPGGPAPLVVSGTPWDHADDCSSSPTVVA